MHYAESSAPCQSVSVGWPVGPVCVLADASVALGSDASHSTILVMEREKLFESQTLLVGVVCVCAYMVCDKESISSSSFSSRLHAAAIWCQVKCHCDGILGSALLSMHTTTTTG